MANKVLNYHPQPYGEYQLGFCNVNLGDKCSIALKVLKSRQGNVYCAFNTVKIGEIWTSDFSFTNKDYERKFLSECLEQVKQMMVVASEEKEAPIQQDPTQSEKGLPF